MRCSSLFLLVIFVSLCSGTQDLLGQKVLFVGKSPDHPHGTHMYMHTCGVLAKCVAQVDGVSATVSNGWPTNPDQLKEVATIVMYTTPAAEFLLDAPHRDEVVKMMQQGVGLATIHWASSVQMDNLQRLGPRWLSMMGATWVSNVGLHTGDSPLEQLQPKHPISRGWDEYTIHDEYYLNPTIKDAKPFLSVTAKGQPVTVAWTFERPNGGRSFGTTLGHFYRNFQQETFRRMVLNAILWTAHVDVPPQGFNVELKDSDLALPPKPKS